MTKRVKYYGITHHLGSATKRTLRQWNKDHCSKNEHLFDEVLSGDEHYLVCDACQLVVHIKGVETKWVKP